MSSKSEIASTGGVFANTGCSIEGEDCSASTGVSTGIATEGVSDVTSCASSLALPRLDVVSSSAMASPTLTVSPSDTKYFTNWPSNGLGTSIVALSDSKTSNDPSSSTLSPIARLNSITSTDSAPPRSGTTTVFIDTQYSSHVYNSC